jgi:RNA polymerase sigma-70 factor (ECF subfamily)
MGGEVGTDHDSSSKPLWSESPEAWDRLIEAVGPASLLVVINARTSAKLKRVVTADDLFQSALLRAWRSRHDFQWRGLKSFRSWLLTIIDHCIRDAADHHEALKRGAGAWTVPFSALDNEDRSAASAFAGPVTTTTPSRVAIYREQSLAMQAALHALPDEVRDVVRMRLFEQRTMQEIAETLGLGVSAVRHRFRSGAASYHRRLVTELASRSVPPESSESSALDGPDTAPE